MILLTWIRSLYKVLSADASPAAIAFGIAFGTLLGCVPITSGLGLLLVAAILVFRVQLSSALLAMGLAKLAIACGAGAIFVPAGEMLLENDPLRPMWTTVLNLPVVAWLDLDVLGVMGGAAIGLAAGLALFWPVRQLVVSYRRCVHEKVAQNRFFQTITNFWFIKALRFIFIGGNVVAG
jgi:uncharacterized protein (TIGR03546 family)